MKKITLLLIGLFIFLISSAQESKPTIQWDKTVHDFGTFKEEAGLQTATFLLKNTGTVPLVITNVKSSCGCTVADYTKEPIAPNAEGFVKATYNPRNRPNKFSKTVTVYSNSDKPTTLLRIQGNVIPREKGIEDYYTKVFEDLRLKSSHLGFNKVVNTQVYEDTLGIVNMGEADMAITFANVPKHIKISVEPQVLKGKVPGAKHGQKGVIKVTYDAKLKSDWGFVMDRIGIVINGEKNHKNRISISANIGEDFSHLSEEELAKAPKVEFDLKEFEFGTLKQGEKVVHNFTFKNTGKTDLVIRKIKAACGCTATNPEKMVIKPGETSHITSTFNSAGKKGRQNRTITVITNDPSQSSIVLKMTGNVEL